MKAFSLGGSKKPVVSKKELEKLKKEEDAAAALEAYEQFVRTFEQPSSAKAKVFVKGSVIHPGSGGTLFFAFSSLIFKSENFSLDNPVTSLLILDFLLNIQICPNSLKQYIRNRSRRKQAMLLSDGKDVGIGREEPIISGFDVRPEFSGREAPFLCKHMRHNRISSRILISDITLFP